MAAGSKLSRQRVIRRDDQTFYSSGTASEPLTFEPFGPLSARGLLDDHASKAVTHSFQPNIRPLRFLRVIASEYLAAYQMKASEEGSAEPLPGAAPESRPDVFDISEHPLFDPS